MQINVIFETIGTIRLDVEPYIQAFNVIEMLAPGKLLKFFVNSVILQTDAAPRVAHVSMDCPVRYSFDLLEFLLVEASLHEIQSILV